MGQALCKQLSYIAALLRANGKAHYTEWKRPLLLSAFMVFQNFLFFLLWVVFFGAVRQVKGWQLEDVALMFGLGATTIGLALFMADGARTIALAVQDGSIESFLAKPRHPLPALLLSRSNAASLGDIVSGPLWWVFFAHVTPWQFWGLLGLSVIAAVIFLASLVMFFSLAFWVQRAEPLSYKLFEILITMTMVPQNVQPMGLKLAMFSVLPAGFMVFLPITLLRDFSWPVLAVLLGATVVYSSLAVWVFNVGVRRYIGVNRLY